MRVAAGKLEKAAQDLGRAYAEYLAAYRPVLRAGLHVAETRQDTIEQTVGADALNGLLVQRLRAAGLGPVLDRARTQGTTDDLEGVLVGRIAAHVR
jgi:hypothetical protein